MRGSGSPADFVRDFWIDPTANSEPAATERGFGDEHVSALRHGRPAFVWIRDLRAIGAGDPCCDQTRSGQLHSPARVLRAPVLARGSKQKSPALRTHSSIVAAAEVRRAGIDAADCPVMRGSGSAAPVQTRKGFGTGRRLRSRGQAAVVPGRRDHGRVPRIRPALHQCAHGRGRP
jgi:hypothetical protein